MAALVSKQGTDVRQLVELYRSYASGKLTYKQVAQKAGGNTGRVNAANGRDAKPDSRK